MTFVCVCVYGFNAAMFSSKDTQLDATYQNRKKGSTIFGIIFLPLFFLFRRFFVYDCVLGMEERSIYVNPCSPGNLNERLKVNR